MLDVGLFGFCCAARERGIALERRWNTFELHFAVVFVCGEVLWAVHFCFAATVREPTDLFVLKVWSRCVV